MAVFSDVIFERGRDKIIRYYIWFPAISDPITVDKDPSGNRDTEGKPTSE